MGPLNVVRHSDHRLVMVGIVVITSIAFVWLLDIDHVLKYLFGFEVRGRLWHDLFVFDIFSLVCAVVPTALVYRWVVMKEIGYKTSEGSPWNDYNL